MNDKDRNKEELINELIQLRKRNTELKSSLMEGNPGDLVLPIIDHGRTTNITERKEVKEGLYRSNQKLNEILSSIQDDFYVLDRDWNFVYANRQFTSRIDKEPQDFIGNNIWRMFPKHIGTEYEENIRSVMDKREIRRFDVGGKYTDSYYQMAVFPSEEGITVLGIDITEQKKAEKRIKEQNAQLLQQINLTSMQANLLNLSNEAIFVWDLNGAITYWNAGAEKMYGYSSKEAVGSVSHDLLKTVHPIAIGNIIFMLERYKSWNGEVEHTSKFGKKLYIETSHQVILNELGQQIVLETNRDITQRKKMENDIQNLNCELLKINETLEESNCELEEMNAQLEETNATFEEEISEHKITALELQETLRELSETKNYLNNILESSTKYSIIGKDLNHRILSWNEGAVRNYGYTAEQIIGKDSSTLYSPEDLKSGEVDKMLKLAFEKGVAEGELQRVRKDGSRFIASVVVTRRNDSTGDPIGYLLMSHDISEKKEEEAARKKSEEEIKKMNNELEEMNAELEETNATLEEEISEHQKTELELQETQRAAEAANKAKSQFLTNMSHEIRTPMNGILGMAQLMGMNLEGKNKEMAEIVIRSGKSLLTIINDILDLSRIEAGKVRLSQEEFDINVLVDEVNKLMQPLVEQKGLVYQSYSDKSIPDQLTGDPDRLKQVLFNLLGNAIKFTEQGSIELTIAKGKVFENNLQLVFSIEDSGIGIGDDKIGKLFTYFTQGDDSVTKKYGGTGLGLAISKQLVNMMDGEISVESKLEVGSKFVFNSIFKLKDGEKKVTKVDTGDVPSVAPVSSTALLVEDDYVSGLLMKMLCERKNMNLKIATSGKEALDLLKEESFDIIFMDIQMPDISGYETTKFIRGREKPLNKHTPIVATTAFALIGDREKCIEAGMDDYLAKPIVAEKFYGFVDKYVNRKHFDK